MKNKTLFVRSVKVALVVGMILNLINNYDLFLGNELNSERVFKITLTFFVPFFVSLFAGHKAANNKS